MEYSTEKAGHGGHSAASYSRLKRASIAKQMNEQIPYSFLVGSKGLERGGSVADKVHLSPKKEKEQGQSFRPLGASQ